MGYADRERQLAYLRRYNKDYQRKRYQERVLELKSLVGSECSQCGSRQDLEFDHIDPDTKTFSILRHWKWPIEKLMPELAKCQLLCKDCHKLKTRFQRYGW